MKKQNKLSHLKIFSKLKTTSVFLSVVVFVFLFAASAFALETGIDYGTATGLGTQDLRVTIMRIIQIFLGLVGLIALILTIYAGYVWMTSAGNPERIDTAKKTLRNAAIGLVIIFSAFSIVSFIIGFLINSTGSGGFPGNQPPGGGCTNCGFLGGGIIQSVYPAPFARDIARNTNIAVTFKVPMNTSTIINGCSAAPCSGDLNADNVLIYQDAQGQGAAFDSDEVTATTQDGKTFIFTAKNFLGNPQSNTWYATTLTNDIEKDNGDSAFPGANGFFTWRFEVGTFLDLDPVVVNNVFPEPDNSPDTYSLNIAANAIGSITIGDQPNIGQTNSATATRITPPYTCNDGIDNDSDGLIDTNDDDCPSANSDGEDSTVSPSVIVNGSYNGTYSGTLTLVLNSGATKTSATASWSPDNDGAPTSYSINSNVIILGDGITLTLVDPTAAADEWEIDLSALLNSDILRVDTKNYTFVDGSPQNSNQIQRGANESLTASNIATRINLDNLAVSANAVGSVVNLEANVAGFAGNFIVVSATGSFATIPVPAMSGGLDPTFTPNPGTGIADKPRNAVFIIDFNEPVNPITLTADNIIVEREDPDNPGVFTAVNASILFSNQYRTIEIFSNEVCEDAAGDPVFNSCGDQIFCWPVYEPDDYAPTQYKVRINGGLIKDCANDNDNCTDPNFPICVSTNDGSACQGTFDDGDAFHPETRLSDGLDPAGIVDMADNTFNGNKDTYSIDSKTFGKADGPSAQNGQAPYSLNAPVDTDGDDFVWTFYLNTQVDLIPPTLSGISPDISEPNVSLVAPIEGTFDEIVLASTLRPGSGYRDGLCYCDDVNNTCPADQTCDLTIKRCRSNSDTQVYCQEDSECVGNLHPDTGDACINKTYVTLVDNSTAKVGWWITKFNLDTGPIDGFADQSMGQIQHSIFPEVTDFGAAFGSGIKDAFQNCYIPSSGPGVGGGTCAVSDSQPYCCNGVALSESDWITSDCNTGL